MNRLGLTAKLMLGFGMLLAMLMLSGGVTYVSVLKISTATEAANGSLDRIARATRIEIAVREQIQNANDYTFNGDAASLQRYVVSRDSGRNMLGELNKILSSPEDKKLLSKLEQSTNEISVLTEQQIAFRQQSRTYEATDMAFGAKEEQAIKAVADSAAQLEAWEDKAAQEDLAKEHWTQGTANLVAVCLVLGGLLLGATTAVLIVRSIRSSMSTMLAVIEEVAAKDLTAADIPIKTNDEIGRAATALNAMKNSLRGLIRSIADTTHRVASASDGLSATSRQITANSQETSTEAAVVSEATQRVSRNLQSVSTGAAEMTDTIQDIAGNAHRAAQIAATAVQSAQSANGAVAKLGQSSAEIGEVIRAITSIAEQTNLLALNATIEAARAGEAGKGFAVVANEVKELAKQTATATEDISCRIAAIQTDTKGAVEAIVSIRSVINQVSEISETIATAVEQQSATTNEMTRNVADAAKGAGEISHSIEGVAQATQGTSASAQESQTAANELAGMAAQLRTLVAQFKIDGSQDAPLHISTNPLLTRAARAGQ